MARLLPPQRLARIAARWVENMDATATVLPQTQVANTGGETELSYPAPTEPGLTVYPCRMRPGAPPEEGVVADQERGRQWWRVQLPVAAKAIVPSDRLYIAGTDADGASYAVTVEVQGHDGAATWQAVLTATCWSVVVDTPTIEGL